MLIVGIIVVFLVLGILLAVFLKKKGSSTGEVLGGGDYGAAGFEGRRVPQFVGGDYGAPLSSVLPTRAWNESASVFVRR